MLSVLCKRQYCTFGLISKSYGQEIYRMHCAPFEEPPILSRAMIAFAQKNTCALKPTFKPVKEEVKQQAATIHDRTRIERDALETAQKNAPLL